jgi:predicted metalloendopeptidase
MKSGIDQSLFNKNIRPQDDLYRFANGAWLSTAKIPDELQKSMA